MSKEIDITKPLRTKNGHHSVVILSNKGPGPFKIVGYIVDSSSQYGTVYQWSPNDGTNKYAGLPHIENEPEPPKMVPLDARDFKFGDLIRNVTSQQLSNILWTAVCGVDKEKIFTAFNGSYSFDYLQRNYQISRDGGKTWEKCEKPESK